MTRVAALQFASGTSVEDNLATCLRMIEQGAATGAEILVMPEFCNHISWYDDHEHARRVSVRLGDKFLGPVAAAAARWGVHVVINVSLRGDNDALTVSSLLFGPDGEWLAQADKQTLMGHENIWFERARYTSPVVELPMGRIGMFPCRDGVTFETPRGLALRGAQLFCDSLNSFALDEASLHVPARAPENRCFLAAANKVGPLIPEALISAVSAETHIPERFLHGAGESQIVAPDGRILARAPAEGEAVIWADVDLAEADDKRRPDGGEPLSERRPELYAPLARQDGLSTTGPAESQVQVATVCPSGEGSAALDSLEKLLPTLDEELRLAVLPELFCLAPDWIEDIDAAVAASEIAVEKMTALLADRPQLTLCTSLLRASAEGPMICGLLIGNVGVLGEQLQRQVAGAHRGKLVAGSDLAVIDLPWGRVAMLVGEESVYPEYAKLSALAGAHVLAVPFQLEEAWELEFGLPSRSAENRVCVVAASRPREGRAGLIASLERDFTIMTPWQERSFDGYINQPIVTPQSTENSVTTAWIHPAAAANKLMSQDTDLLADRPWRLCGDLVCDEPGEEKVANA